MASLFAARRPIKSITLAIVRGPLSPNQDEQCQSVGDSLSLSTSLNDQSSFRRPSGAPRIMIPGMPFFTK